MLQNRRAKWGLLFIIGLSVFVMGWAGFQFVQTKRFHAIALSQETCTAPCWQYLQPGTTTESDFWNWYIANPKFKGQPEMVEIEDSRYIYLPASYLGMTINFWFRDDILQAIEFSGNPIGIPLDRAVRELGIPNSYAAQWISDMNFYHIGGLMVFYEEAGLILLKEFLNELPTGSIEPECKVKVIPKLYIDHIYLVEPNSGQEMLENSYGKLKFQRNATVQKWQEFGLLSMHPCFP